MRNHLKLLVALLPACAGWTKTNTAMELAFTAEQAVDYHQTSEAVTYGAEWNPVIGAWGQNVPPAAYFITTTLVHLAIARMLPKHWREAFQGVTLASQAYNIYGNVGPLRAMDLCRPLVGTPSQCSFGGQ